MKIFNSWWMYLLGAMVTVFVLATSIFFILRAYKDAKELNMDKNMLKKVIINSAVFTILPSVSILIGVIALAGYIGIPLPWIRLSVIGALHYEGTAVDTVLDLYNVLSVENKEIFVTVAFVMTLGIIVGPLFCLFGFEWYDNKVLSKTRVDNVEDEQPVAKENKEETNKNEKPKPKTNKAKAKANKDKEKARPTKSSSDVVDRVFVFF
jgi:magnesium-transporting ATPase (P-type)